MGGGLITLIPVSELAISVLNLIITSQVPPRQLPKLEMRGGIPARDRTMVVVPAIVDSIGRLDSLLDDLEVRFFANRDPHLHFALLSDFADSEQPSQPGDAALVEAATARVAELNARHGADRFFLFHRERRWNPREQRWMGWERKRGKLQEFNRLLRGGTDTSFIVRHGACRFCRPSATSSRWIPTRSCRSRRPAAGRNAVASAEPARFDAGLKRVTKATACSSRASP